MTAARRHLPAAIGFAVLAVVWSYPLVVHLSTHMPGGLGDNEQFLWDFWWMRTALESGADFFHTPYLFAPVGADLTLHTHTALAAFVGATLLGRLPVVTALNLTTLATLSLNGFCGYLLAYRITRDRGAAVLAGIIFGMSPYVAAHLNGHYDLIMPWTIALFALTVPHAIGGSIKWALISGAVLALTAYVSYYYVVYEIALMLCLVVLNGWQWSFTLRATTPYPRWISVLVVIALLLDVAALVLIFTTGGFAAQMGPLRISMRDPFNPLEIFWVLLAIAILLQVRPRLRARTHSEWPAVRFASALAAMFGTFLILASPVVWHGVRVLVNGEYVTQKYYWRSAPVGIDVLTLLLGNPFHGMWGDGVRHLYERMSIDVIESGAWLGIVPLVFAVYAARRRWSDKAVRQWAVVGAVFFVWALGSLVHAAGRNTAMIAPEFMLRYVPLAANARMPGRAMVVVYLAIAMLAAIGAARWRTGRRRPALAMSVVAGLAFADFLVAPFPLAAVDCPAIYHTLRDRPERGTLAELPLGLGDGFGPVSPIDPWMLACQMIHERPMLGGVISRLPRNVLVSYNADPLIAAWLRLSGARADATREGPLPDRESAAARLKADGIAFLILHRGAASPELREYVERVLPLTPVAEDGDRVLYVTGP
ncbi:MAG TPA: hypothetical protein VGJ39_10660 [Vicinamibacterales bacterium]